MRYWQHGETGKLLKIDVQMAPSNWIELTEEQYQEAEIQKDWEAFVRAHEASEALQALKEQEIIRHMTVKILDLIWWLWYNGHYIAL